MRALVDLLQFLHPCRWRPQGSPVSGLLDDVETMTAVGHHFTVFVSDVAVLAPEKYEIPMDDSASR